jgi:hypothetical protein
MTLQSSGQISIGDIATELSKLPGDVSLHDAETGVYGTINHDSPSYPDGNNPNSISEWYSYNHSAVGLTAFDMDETAYESSAAACGSSKRTIVEFYHDGAGTYPANGDVVHTTSGGGSPFGGDDFYYWVDVANGTGRISGAGVVSAVASC